MQNPSTWNYDYITPKEQEKLLINAANDEVFDNTLQINSRLSLENNGKIKDTKLSEFNSREKKIIGYCKTYDCKVQHPVKIIHSVDFGQHVYYHCLKCLSNLICISREQSKGPLTLIHFKRPDNENDSLNNVTLSRELPIKVTKNKIFVDSVEVIKSSWEQITTDESIKYNSTNQYSEWVLVIYTRYSLNNQILNGYYRGYIKGRYFCKNQYYNTCLSDNTSPRGFVNKSVPNHMPTWKENHNPGYEGKLITYEYCLNCSKKPNEKSIEKTRNDELKDTIIELMNEVKKLQIENTSLRNTVAELKANELKYKLKLNC